MKKSPHEGRRIAIGLSYVPIAIYRRPALHPVHETLPLDPNGTPTSVAVAATQCLWLGESASKGSPQPSIQHGKSTVGMYKCSHASSSPSLPPSPFCEAPLSGSAIFRSGNLGDGTWLGPTTSGEGPQRTWGPKLQAANFPSRCPLLAQEPWFAKPRLASRAAEMPFQGCHDWMRDVGVAAAS